MKQKSRAILIVGLLFLFSHSNNYTITDYNSSKDSMVARVCATGLAVAGVVGAAMLAEWYFSETDEQLIVRFDHECRNVDVQYKDAMNFLERSLGIYDFPVDSLRLLGNYSESALYELATDITNNGMSQCSYRATLYSVKNQLRSSFKSLNKRIYNLERKNCTYEEQKRLQSMRSLASSAEKLIYHIVFFSDYLEHHRGYFDLYDTVNMVRNNYAHCFAIVEQGTYAEINLKNGIISAIGGRYPFSSFINTIEPDISYLQSAINSLTHTYEIARRYAVITFNQLMWMKNIVITDSRYIQECYQQEQERLQRLQLQAMQAQARAEWARVDAMLEQNKILRQNNDLKRQEMLRNNVDTNVTFVVNM